MTRARFTHSEIPGSQLAWQLPEAYRSLQRPSSASSAKASTWCPLQLAETMLALAMEFSRIRAGSDAPADPARPPSDWGDSRARGSRVACRSCSSHVSEGAHRDLQSCTAQPDTLEVEGSAGHDHEGLPGGAPPRACRVASDPRS